MKNECSIVRDLLPLYVENMVSDETAAFVTEHLEDCIDCDRIYHNIKDEDDEIAPIDKEKVEELKRVRKKIVKKFICVVSAVCGGFIALILLINFMLGVLSLPEDAYGPMVTDYKKAIISSISKDIQCEISESEKAQILKEIINIDDRHYVVTYVTDEGEEISLKGVFFYYDFHWVRV